MKSANTLPGYAIRRDNNELVFTVGPVAHREFVWNWFNCFAFGTPRMDPVIRFKPGGEFAMHPLGMYDFSFSIEDWNRAILPRLVARGLPALPDGGYRGEEFPTHGQELIGAWHQVAEVLCFATIYKQDRACDMVDLLEIGASMMGDFPARPLFPAGDEDLVPEQIVGALENHYKSAETMTFSAGTVQRQLLWLVRQHNEMYCSPLCFADSVFGISISLSRLSGSQYYNVLWTDTPVSVDLHAPITTAVTRRIITRLEAILDNWNDNENGQVERFDKITDEQKTMLKAFFAAELVRLPARCNGDSKKKKASTSFEAEDLQSVLAKNASLHRDSLAAFQRHDPATS